MRRAEQSPFSLFPKIKALIAENRRLSSDARIPSFTSLAGEAPGASQMATDIWICTRSIDSRAGAPPPPRPVLGARPAPDMSC